MYYSNNIMGDKSLLNFGPKFQLYLSFHMWNNTIAIAMFGTKFLDTIKKS